MEIRKMLYKYRYVLVLLTGVLAGSVYVNLFRNTNATSLGVYGSDYLSAYAEVTVNNVMLWRYVLQSRIRDFLLICLIGITTLKKPAFYIYMVFIGACMGMLISTAVMRYGVIGILIYICSIVPQYILYAIALWLLYRLFYVQDMHEKKWWLLVWAFILVLLGTYMEAYVNPFILRILYWNTY